MNWDEMGLQDAGIKPNHFHPFREIWEAYKLEMKPHLFTWGRIKIEDTNFCKELFVRPCQIPNLLRRLPMELEVTEIGIFTGKWKGTNDGSQPWILMPAQRFPDDDKLEEHVFFFARGCPENVPIIQEMGYSNGILGYSPLIIHTVCTIPYLHGDIFYFHHVTVATSSLMIGGIDWVAAERDLPNLKMDISGHQVSSFTRG